MTKLTVLSIDPSDARLIALLPRLEGQRRFLKNGRFGFEPTAHNLELFSATFPDLPKPRQTSQQPRHEAIPHKPSQPYCSRTSYYPCQASAAEAAKGRSVFGFFCEQGTGKSKLAIDKAGEHFCAGEISGVLVVAPKGVHRQWVDQQIPTHLGEAVEREMIYWPLGARKKKQWAKVNDNRAGLCWFAINIDSMKTKSGFAACSEFIASHKGRVLMIIDESHTIKNARSARWKKAAALGGYCSHRLLLTGTVIAKDLTDEWAQLKWLDEVILGHRYVTSFRAEYCIMGGYEGRQVTGHRNWRKFRKKVDPFTYRITKDDMGILPKVHDQWTFDLTADQKRMIKETKKELIASISSGEIVSSANAAVAVNKIQQIASGFITDTDNKCVIELMPHDKNPRLQALLEKLEELGDRKVAIWAKHVYDIKLICKILGNVAVPYYGATSDEDRAKAVKQFTDPNSNVRYFVSNPASGGTGLNLQACCNRAIYYSNSDNAIHRWQSEDRIHRIGTTGTVIYTDLIAVGSTDRKILQGHKRKETVLSMAVGDIANWLTEAIEG